MEADKQKAIEFAYGEYFELLKDVLDENWWCNLYWDICEILNGISKPNSQGTKWRPLSLQGIENNNGWIKINSEEDLPKEDCNCHIEYKDGTISIDKYYKRYRNFNTIHYRQLVAYRPINEPPKRIY